MFSKSWSSFSLVALKLSRRRCWALIYAMKPSSARISLSWSSRPERLSKMCFRIDGFFYASIKHWSILFLRSYAIWRLLDLLVLIIPSPGSLILINILLPIYTCFMVGSVSTLLSTSSSGLIMSYPPLWFWPPCVCNFRPYDCSFFLFNSILYVSILCLLILSSCTSDGRFLFSHSTNLLASYYVLGSEASNDFPRHAKMASVALYFDKWIPYVCSTKSIKLGLVNANDPEISRFFVCRYFLILCSIFSVWN